MAAKVYKIIKVQISKSKKMKSLIPLSLTIHSENIESNHWGTQKTPDENPKYSTWRMELLSQKLILEITPHLRYVKSKCHCFYIPIQPRGRKNQNLALQGCCNSRFWCLKSSLIFPRGLFWPCNDSVQFLKPNVSW